MDNENNTLFPGEETANNNTAEGTPTETTPATEQQSGNFVQNPYQQQSNPYQPQQPQQVQQPPYNTPPTGNTYQSPNNTYYPPVQNQPYYGGPPKQSNGTAIASLVLGIIGMFSAFLPLGIVGLCLGISSKKKLGKNGISTGGIITSIIAIIFGIIAIISFIAFISYAAENSNIVSDFYNYY